MSLAMKARQKVKRKGAAKDRVFGCDLVEHLQSAGQEVPQVLKSCTEFVEQHGIVDGIYRLSGVSSNTQKLRLEFDSDRNPDLHKEVYLQDIHCVSSLCKAYFRELPNPLLTYQLYDKFAEAVAIQLEEGRLEKIKEVVKELPSPHYRTLEFLMKHLVRMASFSSQTNMHVRNLAIVWAPNLLRSKDIEVSGFNGTAAFMEVRIQSIVVEFILTHVEQIFGNAPLSGGIRQSLRKSLLASQASLSEEKLCFPYQVTVGLSQGDGPTQIQPYHTIIEFNNDSKRKGSLKAKKWKSIFNLGRSSQDSKRKLNKPEEKDDKASKVRLRPAKSMDSLSCLPSASDGDAQLRGQSSERKLTLCRESSEGPGSLDSHVLESGCISVQRKSEDLADDAVKSEPPTPHTSRSHLLGETLHGRSPKTACSRAEKCAGVHISGPFSVTVPFHITSNLTLSRLTRGLECPALLSHCPLGNEGPEAAQPKQGDSYERKEDDKGTLEPTVKAEMEETEGAVAKVEAPLDLEENRLSLEVQASFSFLDSQDAWIAESPEDDQLLTVSSGGHDSPSNSSETLPGAEDDFGSGFMNEMIGDGMEMATYHTVAQMDYLSIEECMNEQSEGEDDQYYLAMGFTEEELPTEVDAEEVYLSAFDEISPLADDLEKIQQLNEDQTPDTPPPKLTVDDDTSGVDTGALPEGPESLPWLEGGAEHPKGEWSASGDLALTKCLQSELVALSPEESGIFRNARNNSNLEDKDEVAKLEAPGFLLLQAEDVNVGNEVDVSAEKTERPEEETACERSLDSESESLSLEGQWPLQNMSWEQTPGLSRHAHVEAVPSEMNRRTSQPLAGVLVHQEPGELPSGEATSPLPSLEELPLPPPLLDRDSKNGSPALPDGRCEGASSGAAGGANAPALDSCMKLEDFSPAGPPPKPCLGLLQKPPCELPVEASYALKRGLLDGSLRMKLTSNITRVQQVKSFPVVPPKPQFAKVPPSLKPVTPNKEPLIMWPNVAASVKDQGIEVEQRPVQSPPPRPSHPISLDSACHPTEILPKAEATAAGSPAPETARNMAALPNKQQRNSMPVSLESFSRDCKRQESLSPKPQDKPFPWIKSGAFGGSSFHLAGSLDEQQGSWHSDGKGGLSPQQPSDPFLPEKPPGLGFEAAPPTQRWSSWSSWRNGGSRSFDEAVALAKERHVAQALAGKKPAGCEGDLEGRCGPFRTAKPAPHPQATLRPPGQPSHRPPSCPSTAAAPEAPLLLPPGLPNVTPEGSRPEGQKGLAFPQDFPPRNRPNLAKIGRRLSMSDEACFAWSHEPR